MGSRIIERIERALGAPGLAAKLADLPATDLQSLLLEVTRARSRHVAPASLLDERKGLVSPSAADARAFNLVDAAAYEAAAAFDALELSPVEPAGTNTVLGGIDQNSTLCALRGTEVLSDPTAPQALEAARRRKRDASAVVRLCASQRLIRMQPFEGPGFSRHFRLFSMVTAGRDTGEHRFETAALAEQLTVYLRFFQSLRARGYSLGAVTIELADTGTLAALPVSREELAAGVRAHKHGSSALLESRAPALPRNADEPPAQLPADALLRLQRAHERIAKPLMSQWPDLRVRYDCWRLEGMTYYRGLCFRISVVDPSGAALPICDGGFVDWTARLLSNAKERLLISGIGTEVLVKRYRAQP